MMTPLVAAERIAELKEKLEGAKSFLQDTSSRREKEKERLQRQVEVSEKIFEGLCGRAKKEVEDIEKRLKAEVRSFTLMRNCRVSRITKIDRERSRQLETMVRC